MILDVEDVVPGGKYSLEVSSPGLERSLKEVWHFEKAIDKKIKVKTEKAYMPQEGPETKKGIKLIKGTLKEVIGDSFLVEDAKNRIYKVVISDVSQAHTVFEFNQGKKKSK